MIGRRRGLTPALTRVTVVLAAGVIVVAFFLPWMDGEGEFRYRAFSGFDFARLVRNFEITATSPSGVGQVRATAIALYLVPALAVNAAVLCGLALANRRWTGAAGLASVIASLYTITVLSALVAFSALPVTDLADVVGRPQYGWTATGVAAFTMGVIGLRELWHPASNFWRPNGARVDVHDEGSWPKAS